MFTSKVPIWLPLDKSHQGTRLQLQLLRPVLNCCRSRRRRNPKRVLRLTIAFLPRTMRAGLRASLDQAIGCDRLAMS